MDEMPTNRQPWRAWNTFVLALACAGAAILALMLAALYLRLRQGAITTPQATLLLDLLRDGTYPIAFVALGALAWHYVRFYRGDYARR